MNDVVWLTMRRMRTPLIVMILVYSLSVVGMVLIPGQDAQGRAIQVGYLDAAYFIAILATTIGFGEIPVSFTGMQRFYVFIILLPNVVAWLYSVGTILGMFLDQEFRYVIQRSRFSSRVRKLSHGFFIVCGFGNTGRMIVGGLLRRGHHCVVLEQQPEIIHRMVLSDAISHVPALAADSTDHETLELAGLLHRHCLGVMATTNDDHANLTIAITSKLLRPDLTVMARSDTPRVTANMASFGTDYTVDSYGIFAERLFLAFSSPVKYLVQDWLISVPGSPLRAPLHPPAGRWLLCGVGSFGSRIAQCLDDASMPYTVVDVHPERVAAYPGGVLGRGTEAETLLQAGIEDSVGVIAGTSDDVDNLSIIMTARNMKRELFTIARQEHKENDELFDASGADLVARRSLIAARRLLLVATTPLLQTFLQHLIQHTDEFAQRVAARLQSALGGTSPAIWTVALSGDTSRGLVEAKKAGVRIHLHHLLQTSRLEEPEQLPAVCLLMERGAARTFLPEASQELHLGDRLLFAGRDHSHWEINWSLTEPYALIVNATGRIMPRGALWRRLGRRKNLA